MMLGKLSSYMQKKKKKKLYHYLIPYTIINSKWFKDLSVRLETIKLLKENTDNLLFDISLSNIFADLSPWVRETKAKINKWD